MVLNGGVSWYKQAIAFGSVVVDRREMSNDEAGCI